MQVFLTVLLQNGLKIVNDISRGCAPDPLTPGQVRGVPEGCRRAEWCECSSMGFTRLPRASATRSNR